MTNKLYFAKKGKNVAKELQTGFSTNWYHFVVFNKGAP